MPHAAKPPPRNLWTDVPTQAGLDGAGTRLVHAVIEIPAGTTAKWMVGEDGRLVWEREGGQRRIVRYLAYPANYGMIPRTLQPSATGGDGDPLDVVVLGDALERGAVVPVRLIGLLRLTDTGERDDKLIAVRPGTPLGAVRSLGALDGQFPGITAILETWFTHYKGTDRITSGGFEDAETAYRMLREAEAGFAEHGPVSERQ